jgi:hypothetical protein
MNPRNKCYNRNGCGTEMKKIAGPYKIRIDGEPYLEEVFQCPTCGLKDYQAWNPDADIE